MTTYRYLGYGTTDSTGVAKLDHDAEGTAIDHSYTGSGAGKVDLIASLDDEITSDSVISDGYSFYDVDWIYAGTSHKSSHFTETANSDGSYTFGTDGTDYGIFQASTTIYQGQMIYADVGECFEFDLLEYSGAITLRANIADGENRTVNNIWNEHTHYKLEVIDNGVIFNGQTITFDDTGARKFMLRLENGATFKIKNLVYY